jgi:hypothetical protein
MKYCKQLIVAIHMKCAESVYIVADLEHYN